MLRQGCAELCREPEKGKENKCTSKKTIKDQNIFEK
jgi:hypothetical protein